MAQKRCMLKLPNICLSTAVFGGGVGAGDVYIYATLIGLIRDSPQVGFQIVMQIIHVLCWGQTLEKKANCGKSARRNIEITLLKVRSL